MAAPRHCGVMLFGALMCVTTATVNAQVITVAPPADTVATGAIIGELIDSSSGKPISQAQVSLRGTTRRTTTDMSGSFAFRALLPGRYALEARRIGYEPLVREDVSVMAGEGARLAIFMRPAAFQLAQVTVTPGSFFFLVDGTAMRHTRSRA